MKKRILSFALVMAMMISMFIIPTKAEAWTFDDLFEELDARNIGQTQFDVGAGETTGVIVDGKVDANDNYTVTKVVTYESVNGSNTAGAPDFTVSMARKGTDLYVAFVVAETEANSTKGKIQLGIGPSKGPTLSDAVVRTMPWLNANSTLGFNGTTYYGGPAGNDDANNPYLKYCAAHEYKKAWADGYSTYEVKISIRDVALQMTKTKTSGAWTKLTAMQIMWFYYPDGSNYFCYYHNPGAAWNNAANPYKDKYTAQGFVDALKAHYGHTYGGVGTVIAHPIAFGGVEIDTGIGVQDPLGAVGTDIRNLADAQVINIATIAENVPELDGVIDDGEYTVTGKELEKAKEAYKDLAPAIANLSYKDGYLYLGVTTDDKALVNTQLDLNAMPFATFADQLVNRHSSGYNGGTDVINAGGATSSMENGSDGWMNADQYKGMFDNTAKVNFIVDAAAALNAEGNAVYEYKISVALLADFYCKAYDIDDGITYFGLQFWHAGNDGAFGSNDDQHGFRKAAHGNAANILKAIDAAAWGLEWTLYTIVVPETVDKYQAEHKIVHNYELGKDFATLNSGSIRITADESLQGIRFKTIYSDEYLAKMQAYAEEKGETLEIGTIIAPKAFVEAAGSFTKEALEAIYDYNPYVDVPATVAKPYASADGVTTYAASLVAVNDVEREYAAVGYVQVGEEIFYSVNYAVRSQAIVANAALADVKDTQQEGYIHLLDTGKWSPYSQGWYDIIESMKG